MEVSEMLIAAVIDERYLSLEQVASLCRVDPEWVVHHVNEGLVSALQLETGEWRFSQVELNRVRRIIDTERCFDAVPELAALVADLQEELDSLRRQLQLRR